MTPKSISPPAFPHSHLNENHLRRGDWSVAEGMTLRDYFAAKALQGMLCNGFMPNQVAQSSNERFRYEIAAYKLADAMLKARDQ